MKRSESKVLKSLGEIEGAKRFNQIIIGTLAITCLVLAITSLTKTTEIVVTPPEFYEEIRVAGNQANEHYKVRWAFSTAALAGNITSRNAEFVLTQLNNIFSPYLRESVLPEIQREVQILALRNATQKFVIEDAIYDPARDIVWIFGHKQVDVRSGSRARNDRATAPERWTYEFRVEPFAGRPSITHFDAYPGTPRERDKSYTVDPKPIMPEALERAMATANPNAKVDMRNTETEEADSNNE